MDSWEPVANVKILYITTNFETLTHTFITREVQEVRQAGNEVELLALRRIAPDSKSPHPECDVSGCRYVYPVGFGTVLMSTMRCLLTRPPQITGHPNHECPMDLDLVCDALGAESLDWDIAEKLSSDSANGSN